ncbi:MAG: hypothetical protein HOP20_03790 [Sulfuriferula sp.]|nr:hypothetical protein [Sulfuriferula sp.]
MDKISAILSRIQGERVYIDTNIFVYFLDQNERYFDIAIPFFQLFDEGVSLAHTGADLFSKLRL